MLGGSRPLLDERCARSWTSRDPGVSRFPELNVRTYVTYGAKPGVYFFSLDAASWLAVKTARALYPLPYFHTNMNAQPAGNEIVYRSVRHDTTAEFRGRYGPVAPVQPRTPGSLEHWLTERHCLYAVHQASLCRGEIQHLPWPLQDAAAEIAKNSMATAAPICCRTPQRFCISPSGWTC
jgi:uncharacterized protein YqjF (DUF2071 family)